MRNKIRKILWPISAAILAFLVLSIFLYIKAYFSYDLSILSNTTYLSSIAPTQLAEKLKVSFEDQKGGTFYIDFVEVTSKGELSFTGRYYSSAPANVDSTKEYLRKSLATAVGTFIAEKACSFTIDLNQIQTNLDNQLKEINLKSETCRSLASSQVANNFQISQFKLSDNGRLKKLLFISLLVATFFGGAIYVFIESTNVFKKD